MRQESATNIDTHTQKKKIKAWIFFFLGPWKINTSKQINPDPIAQVSFLQKKIQNNTTPQDSKSNLFINSQSKKPKGSSPLFDSREFAGKHNARK